MNIDKTFELAKLLYPADRGFDVRQFVAFIRHGNDSDKIIFGTEIGYCERDGEIVYRAFDPSISFMDLEEILSYIFPTRELQLEYHNGKVKVYLKRKHYKGRKLLASANYHPTDNVFGEVMVGVTYDALVALGEIKQKEV